MSEHHPIRCTFIHKADSIFLIYLSMLVKMVKQPTIYVII